MSYVVMMLDEMHTSV